MNQPKKLKNISMGAALSVALEDFRKLALENQRRSWLADKDNWESIEDKIEEQFNGKD